jgi:predicted anti-sigma-YlaC factor YlaD
MCGDVQRMLPPHRPWVGLDWLPEHKCGLHLNHNEHRNYYQTVAECYDPEDFVSEDEWLKAIKEDSVWVLQWYPNTPIGFTCIAASTLEAIEDKLKERNFD